MTLSVVLDTYAPTTFAVRTVADTTYHSTGSQVFSLETIPFFSNTRRLRADFAQPVASVSIDFIASDPFGMVGTLEAYNAAGQLLATYDTANLTTPGAVETMSVQRPTADIARIVTWTRTRDFGRLDNLRFSAEPAVTTARGRLVLLRRPDARVLRGAARSPRPATGRRPPTRSAPAARR